MMRCRMVPLIALALLFAAPVHAESRRWLWVYTTCNFQVDKSADDLLALMERAKKAGYNGVQVNDFKFGQIDGRPQRYYVNLKRAKEASDRLGIELIPGVMPIGYSSSILMNNPQLAEGIPVKDCLFKVSGGQATVADTRNLLPGGDFEKAERNRPAGWSWVDDFGSVSALDTEIKRSGKSSLRMTPKKDANARVVRKVKVKPFHQCELNFWAKTQGLKAGEFRVTILAGKRALNHTDLEWKPTQDWTRHTVVFNSLEHEEVNVYLGVWGGRSGTFWYDDAELRCVGGVNLVRREGCPLRVTSEDGQTVYEEGKDFERWFNPKTGNDPYPGAYKITTPQPPIVIPKGSRIAGGQTLKVSYYHTIVILTYQVASCLIHDELFEHLETHVRNVKKHLAPKTYFMQHDELRLAGWCDLCHKPGRTTGELLAENARRCVEIIRKVDPDAEIFVWSDMFDPNHNAHDNFYLVRDDLAGSWKGLDKKVVIANWHSGKARDSLGFFADRGHRQLIAGYYDHDDVAGGLNRWFQAAEGRPGVTGYMYTTWRRDYRHLERFAELVRQHARAP